MAENILLLLKILGETIYLINYRIFGLDLYINFDNIIDFITVVLGV